MGLSVRPLRKSDVQIWRALVNEMTELYPHALHTTPEEARRIPEEEVEAILADGRRIGIFETFGEEEDCVGLAALTIPNQARALHRRQLVKFYIRPHAQMGDAPVRLMLAVLKQARSERATQIELALSTATRASETAFFESFGFEEVGRLPAAIVTEDGPMDDIHFVLKLETIHPKASDQSRSSVTMRSGATSMNSSSLRIASIMGSGPHT